MVAARVAACVEGGLRSGFHRGFLEVLFVARTMKARDSTVPF
jgi:hypothetical protein